MSVPTALFYYRFQKATKSCRQCIHITNTSRDNCFGARSAFAWDFIASQEKRESIQKINCRHDALPYEIRIRRGPFWVRAVAHYYCSYVKKSPSVGRSIAVGCGRVAVGLRSVGGALPCEALEGRGLRVYTERHSRRLQLLRYELVDLLCERGQTIENVGII